ncbi:probable two-component response regulator [Fulvimarina pelagi HTCC2506]|uniref:Probable two-component response regulator n=2 Tax=Fulvimarina pelagi TaxID=217511 RepID=Q0FYA1_9HYPH|nr:response regulator transcription factor [Fulvimarina pelagi]EAU40094.1 probable two-component response regulator [Fulvimarina pelagi HTCC2506]BAT31132.1 probable two-component response regulator [Fulvimarina pelagi]
MTTFLLIDDHPLFRDALRAAIEAAVPESEILETDTIEAAIVACGEETKSFDLALLDLTMPGVSGFEGLLELRARFPKLPILVVSALDDPKIVRRVLSYGAAGFVSKSAKKLDLATAITEVLSGSVYVQDELIANGPEDHPDVDSLASRVASLTPQQLRVLSMIRQGLLNKQIAYELSVGETTVKAHVSEILRKLNVFSRTQAVIEISKLDFDSVGQQSNQSKRLERVSS